MIGEKEFRDRLAALLQEYDKVFVAGSRPLRGTFIFQKLSELSDRNFILLVSEENQDAAYVRRNGSLVISREEYHCLEELYYMYEFSDRLYLLTDNAGYAGLGNYVSSNILTEEEMAAALLGIGY